MMASGEIRLFATMMRRMPVLAQSQNQGQGQIPMADPTPEQIQDANDQWSDVQAAQDKATADQSKANGNPSPPNWAAVAEDWATAARLMERWYALPAIGTPASPLPSPDNGKDPNPSPP
jgi:hypothetical protein